jgi:tetraacyldisaccharide 4'-kinase
MRVNIDQAIRIGGDQTRDLGNFTDKIVHVIAGIGNPDRFFTQLQAHGIDLVPHRFGDHHAFTPADLDFAAADHDIVVLMTEKDAVKCEPMINSDQFWRVPLVATLDPALITEVFARLPTVKPPVRPPVRK